jgi:hypothetical protein
MTTRARVVVSVILAVAVAGLVWSFTLFRQDTSTPAVKDTAVVSVTPTPGSHVLRQTLIAYQLDAAYTGVIQVDDVEIPDDQLEHTSLTNQIGYVPAADKQTGVLKAGRHCATGEFWPRSVDRAQARTRTYTWCFSVA